MKDDKAAEDIFPPEYMKYKDIVLDLLKNDKDIQAVIKALSKPVKLK